MEWVCLQDAATSSHKDTLNDEMGDTLSPQLHEFKKHFREVLQLFVFHFTIFFVALGTQ